jgi:hypothetical protein
MDIFGDLAEIISGFKYGFMRLFGWIGCFGETE